MTIVAPFTGPAPVPSISLPPFSTIIASSCPERAYLNQARGLPVRPPRHDGERISAS
jgi:hypothetical protein